MNRFLLVGLVMGCVPMLAHHGTNASYDLAKNVTLKATVTEFVWSNPHCALFFDVKDDQGNVVHWVGETNSPGVLLRAGWTRKIMQPGDQITITVHPSKAGTATGVIQTVVLPDGKVLERGAGAAQ
jgi:uncharacterized protein DUF6152